MLAGALHPDSRGHSPEALATILKFKPINKSAALRDESQTPCR